ncbi:GAF and ANTAR domain-containing protein [Nocardia brasiliensis]|uniref:GAF and ANTAR domain-containing protein n=1 Tax=Nocardia brasiliensis TaxID=37326 RepID=UPI00366AC3C4
MAYDAEALVEVLSRFARMLPTEYRVETALDELVSSVTAVLGLTGAGVTMESGGQLRFVTAPSEQIAEVERCQEHAQQGPCVDAHHNGHPVTVDDLSKHLDRWPQYTSVAARYNVAAVAGVPMRLNGHKVGAIDLYADQPRDWSAADVEVARLLADMATGYVVNAGRRFQQQQLTEQLQQALNSRVVIEQAKGIIANARAISPDEAFTLIRRYARAQQAPLHAVARAIVEVGLRV